MFQSEEYYKVAGHVFQISIPDKFTCPANYKPFSVKKPEEVLFHLTITKTLYVEEGKQIGNFEDDAATIGVYAGSNGGYIFRISHPNGEHCCVMTTSADYKSSDVCFEGDSRYHIFGLDNCLMLLFAFASAPYSTLTIHGSVIKYKEKGYVFLGRSGTGKSTHSRLWLEHIEGCELLNDDNPIVRIVNGKIMVYGSPWSGKTQCYKNESAEAGGFVRLQQKPVNNIELNSMAMAFAALKPSCSTAPWSKTVNDGVCNTLTDILQNVKSYTLGCRPDKEAAELCRNTITV